MKSNWINLTHKKFDRLYVLSHHHEIKKEKEKEKKIVKWVCLCDCGKVTLVRGEDLRRRFTRSCGCLLKEKTRILGKSNKIHGQTGTPTWLSWQALLSRCFYEKNKDYYNYGGRGITVCERWHNYENFLNDMGIRPLNHTLDRINSDGNYEPNNCRWATPKEQATNRRRTNHVKRNSL